VTIAKLESKVSVIKMLKKYENATNMFETSNYAYGDHLTHFSQKQIRTSGKNYIEPKSTD